MSKLNPGAFSFVPGGRSIFAQPEQPQLQPIERPEPTEAPKPPPTLTIGRAPAPAPAPVAVAAPASASEPVSAPPAPKPASTVKISKAEGTKAFTAERAKTDVSAVARDVQAAADAEVIKELYGQSKYPIFSFITF